MTTGKGSKVTLSHLNRADGSATYSDNGYSIVGAVNGPVEVQRRDELPEEAAIDVIIRPASGVGGVRERHLESIIEATLRQVILIKNFPRTLIQVTLQVCQIPEHHRTPRQDSPNLLLLPALLQTSLLALLSACIPLSVTFMSVLVVVLSDGNFACNPSPDELEQAASIHVLAFSLHGDLLVVESEGSFDIDIWQGVFDYAKSICCTSTTTKEEGRRTAPEDGTNLEGFLRDTLEKKIALDQTWKESLR
ncbi:MAG: exosome non-catalytic core subunit rrp46 [Peltula sp. TS41687]|nr:MAG: exosome non-catalytic core subunit rrp46 [Peltula sp. TS41687]